MTRDRAPLARPGRGLRSALRPLREDTLALGGAVVLAAEEPGNALEFTVTDRGAGIPAEELLFVSSNAWDVAGAKAFGYQVAWCNRAGAPAEELGLAADVVVTRLDELPR